MNLFDILLAKKLGGESGASSFRGNIVIYNKNYDLSISEEALLFNKSSATKESNSMYIAPSTAFGYNGRWEWCVTYRPQFITSGSVCILGTAYSGKYFANPSIELQENHTKVWFGWSSNGASWIGGLDDAITLSEPITVGTAYNFVIGGNVETEQGYYKITNADTGSALAEGTVDNRIQNHNTSEYEACILGNAYDNKFYFAGDILLKKTYYKENDIVLWGQDGGV